MRNAAPESVSLDNDLSFRSGLDNVKFDVKNYSFLPNMVLERHEECLYLKMVQDILSDGDLRDDRTGTGTLSKFGCQVMTDLP